MRDLSSKIYEAKVQDGSEIHTIFYRRPSNDEIAAYQSSLFKRVGNKIKTRTAEARLQFGKRIITGFKKGTFGYEGKEISSDPKDPGYRSDWKDLLVTMVPDIVAAVGQYAFEGTSVVGDTPDVELSDEFASMFNNEEPENPTLAGK